MNHRPAAPAAPELRGGSGATHASPALWDGDRSLSCRDRRGGCIAFGFYWENGDKYQALQGRREESWLSKHPHGCWPCCLLPWPQQLGADTPGQAQLAQQCPGQGSPRKDWAVQGHGEAQPGWGSSLPHAAIPGLQSHLHPKLPTASTSENLLAWENSSVVDIHLNSPRWALKSFSDRQGLLCRRVKRSRGTPFGWMLCPSFFAGSQLSEHCKSTFCM